MEMLKYTPEFWEKANELVDAERCCWKCRRFAQPAKKGSKRIRIEAQRSILTGLVLKDGNKENLSPSNIAWGCSHCYPELRGKRRGITMPREDEELLFED